MDLLRQTVFWAKNYLQSSYDCKFCQVGFQNMG